MRLPVPLAPLLLLPAAAAAHTGVGAHGSPFVSGLAHPLLGPDHLIAMLAVGLLAGLTGGPARYAYPLSFLAAMMLGGALGYGGGVLPLVEPGILASVIVLGLAVALALRPPLAAACAAIALFGLTHGYAHGLETPAVGLLAYGLGFATSTVSLHAAGLGLGLLAGARRPALARAAGGVAAIGGVALALG